MRESNMKYVLAVAAAVAAIIAVQMILSCVFSSRVGEIFSKTAVSALFYYTLVRLLQKGRKAAC